MMTEIFGKNYYIDLDTMISKCNTGGTITDDDGQEVTEINVFKYEILKMLLDRVLSEVDEIDEEMGMFAKNSTTVSFKLAFNTLIQYGVIIEEEND